MAEKLLKFSILLTAFILLNWNSANAQLLDNDTLYIGSAVGSPGDTVYVPVDIATSEPYSGWQVPIVFGYGDSPLIADSIDLDGSIMTDTTFRPGGWDFIAPFLNNNAWDNVQTCGIAGIVWISPPVQDLPAGHYHVMDLVFYIDDSASAQTIPLDTLGSSWYAGGPVNHYIVVVPPGYSRYTHVVQGEVEIVIPGVAENEKQVGEIENFTVYPSVVTRGSVVHIDYMNSKDELCRIGLFDATGRKISDIAEMSSGYDLVELDFSTGNIPAGIYFIIADTGYRISGKKLIIK